MVTEVGSINNMDDNILLENLNELTQKLSIKVIRDKNLSSNGGLCRYQSKYYLLVKNTLSTKEKINLYIQAITRVLPKDYYVLPKIRELIEKEQNTIGEYKKNGV